VLYKICRQLRHPGVAIFPSVRRESTRRRFLGLNKTDPFILHSIVSRFDVDQVSETHFSILTVTFYIIRLHNLVLGHRLMLPAKSPVFVNVMPSRASGPDMSRDYSACICVNKQSSSSLAA
jgi:hypothetical protein